MFWHVNPHSLYSLVLLKTMTQNQVKSCIPGLNQWQHQGRPVSSWVWGSSSVQPTHLVLHWLYALGSGGFPHKWTGRGHEWFTGPKLQSFLQGQSWTRLLRTWALWSINQLYSDTWKKHTVWCLHSHLLMSTICRGSWIFCLFVFLTQKSISVQMHICSKYASSCVYVCVSGVYIHVLVCLREYIRYVMSNTSHPEEDSLLAWENVVAWIRANIS